MTQISTTQRNWRTRATRKPRKSVPLRADRAAASSVSAGRRLQTPTLTGISLFTGGGVGDLALRAAGVDVLSASELLADRAEVYRANYPESEMIVGDIRETKAKIISRSLELLNGRQLDVAFATPPCQGMSKNGRGKLLNGLRAGLKPQFDDRNTLALLAVEIALELRPRLLVFENVPDRKSVV